MTFLEFIISISFLLVLNGLLINGWHRVTRHFIVVNPDGTETVDGYIFKWWSYFIEGVREERMVFYVVDTFSKKWEELERLLPKVAEKFNYENLDYVVAQKEITKEDIDKIERVLKIEVSQGGNVFSFYINEPIYFLPSWIRYPLSECQVCMASVYGSIVYWGFVFIADGAFNWTSHKNIAILLLYPFFIVVLSCLSYIIARKN